MSLYNWMTNLDLICEEPYKIGLIGSISFISFSIGSLFISRMSDKVGRKKTLIGTGIVTPICLVLCIIAKHLYVVYVVIFVLGVTYNCRAATAYIYGTELMQKKHHMKYGYGLFIFFGTI